MKNIMLIVRMMRDNGVTNWISGSCNHRLLISETWFLPATLTTRPAQPFSTPPISRSLSLFCMLEEIEIERLQNSFSSWFCPGRLVEPVQGRGDSIGQLLCEARPDQDGQLHEPGMNIFRRNMLTWSLIDNSLARDWNCLVTAKSFDKSFSFSRLLCCWQWFMIILSPKKETIGMIFYQEGSFNYYTSEELQAHVVELPYQVRKNRQIMAN